MFIFQVFATLLLVQSTIPLKPSSEFEVKTNYELKKKPASDHQRLLFVDPDETNLPTSDLLPYLTLEVKIKRWHPGVSQIRIKDGADKQHLKKKPNDDGVYFLDMGFVDDMKDNVTSGKFYISFYKDKKTVEQITIEIESDGTFRINGEKRGKF